MLRGQPSRISGTHLGLKQSGREPRLLPWPTSLTFNPRIYHHRLENVIQASARSQRSIDVARVLVRKYLSNISGRNNYGIPIGPNASRVLAEAVLIDVDAGLLSDGADFIRWVDDYTIFCKSEVKAQRLLFRLSEHLFTNHSLPFYIEG